MTERRTPGVGGSLLLWMFLLSVLASLGVVLQSLHYSDGWISQTVDISFMMPLISSSSGVTDDDPASAKPSPSDKELSQAKPDNDRPPPKVDNELSKGKVDKELSRTKAKPDPPPIIEAKNDTLPTKTKAAPSSDKHVSIAYAITVTECSAASASYLDGAAVMAYAIDKHSVRAPKSGSKYDYKLYAFVHPDAKSCAKSLSSLGFDVLIRPTPINVTDIRGPHKEFVSGAGCCGAKEFLKLYSYTLTDHPVVVHLDTDMLLLKPLDDLFDSMLDGPASPARKRLPVMWKNESLPERIEAFFTRDYNMMVPGDRETYQTAVQGGFLVIRPNITQFEQYLEIILEGDYKPEDGWGSSKGLRFGGFYGAPQIQGLCTYFFGHVRAGYSVELNRCQINSMADGPYASEKGVEGKCRTQEKTCEDCRKTNLTDISLVHFTLCSKPWWCREIRNDDLCSDMLNAWFVDRYEMEQRWAKEDALYNTTVVRLKSTWDPTKARNAFCRDGGRYDSIRYPEKLKGR